MTSELYFTYSCAHEFTQDKQWTHEQLSQNIKTVMDHPRNGT